MVSVRISDGCLELPESYRVVQTDKEEDVIDQVHGYIEPPDSSWKVYYSSGFGEAKPLNHGKGHTVAWKRTEVLNGHKFQLGLVKEKKHRSLYAVDDFITSFQIDAGWLELNQPPIIRRLRGLDSGLEPRHAERCRANPPLSPRPHPRSRHLDLAATLGDVEVRFTGRGPGGDREEVLRASSLGRRPWPGRSRSTRRPPCPPGRILWRGRRSVHGRFVYGRNGDRPLGS